MDDSCQLFPELSLIPCLTPLPASIDISVFWVEGRGAMLPHIQAVQNAYLNTSGTRQHLGNTAEIPFLEGQIVSKSLYQMDDIDKQLWQQGSNMTLWVVNALCSLAINVTLPRNFLYNPAQQVNLAPYLGSTPDTVFVGVQFSLEDDRQMTKTYSGTMPAGLFLTLKILFTMANTPVSNRNIWGSIEDYADITIARHLCQESKHIASSIKTFERVKGAIDMVSLESMVHLSSHAARFIELLASKVQTPEPIPPNTRLAENCPSCRNRIFTATPRNKLQPSDEEYEPGNDEVIGDMRLIKVPVRIGLLSTFRYIYVCPHCNDREHSKTKTLRFTHISINPRKRKRESETPTTENKKRKGASRIQDNIKRKLEKIDLIASFFLKKDERNQLRLKTQSIRQHLK